MSVLCFQINITGINFNLNKYFMGMKKVIILSSIISYELIPSPAHLKLVTFIFNHIYS